MTKKTTTKKTKTVKDPQTADVVAQEIIDEAESNGAMVVSEPDQDNSPARLEDDGSGREAALSIVGGVSTEQLKQALVTQTEQRKLIQQFIQDNLVVDVDYGKIHVIKNCMDEERARGSCKKDYHFSKSILFKPGQEKIFSLFGITDELERDEKVYEMLGNVPGMVAFKCVMYRGKNRVGEGRGAATMSGSQNDPNSTIKKAEKRARMDACLSLGFSAYFTQDLDDPEYKSQREMMNEKARNEAEARDKDENGFLPRNPDAAIDNQERALLHRLITKAGFEDRDEIIEFLKANGISDPAAMTSGQARKLIKKMQATEFLGPEKNTPAAKSDDDSNDDGPIVIPPKPPEPMQPAELVIDDDLKAHIEQRYNEFGFNGTGEMWFKKQVTGRPFGSWDKYEDKDWRRAFQFITDIDEGRVEIEPNRLKNPNAAREVPENVDPQTGEILDIDPRDDRDEDWALQAELQMDNNNEEDEHDV